MKTKVSTKNKIKLKLSCQNCFWQVSVQPSRQFKLLLWIGWNNFTLCDDFQSVFCLFKLEIPIVIIGYYGTMGQSQIVHAMVVGLAYHSEELIIYSKHSSSDYGLRAEIG